MQTLKITIELRKRGHETGLLCAPKSSLQREAAQAGIPTWPYLEEDFRLPQNIFRVKKLLQQQHIEVVHTHLSHDLNTLTPAIALSRQVPTLLLSKRMSSSVTKKDFIHRFLYRKVEKVLTVSDFIRDNVLKTCPVIPQQVFTLHNGLELQRYQPEQFSKDEIRTELGLPKQALVIGIVGRITPKKGHMEFLDAAQRIRRSCEQPLKFLIVGGASFGEEAYEQKIDEQIRNLGLEQDVLRTGHRDDIPRLMAAIDILVFPSYAEAFGNILLEAMAMRLPIVAANSGAVPEILVDGQCGLLVPPRRSEPIAERVLELIGNSGLRDQLGTAARERVETRFKFEDFMERLEQHYHE